MVVVEVMNYQPCQHWMTQAGWFQIDASASRSGGANIATTFQPERNASTRLAALVNSELGTVHRQVGELRDSGLVGFPM